ncbi:MAG: hypothetical protein ACKPKO_29280, partial [Candidatus Fonsibacter sp.]
RDPKQLFKDAVNKIIAEGRQRKAGTVDSVQALMKKITHPDDPPEAYETCVKQSSKGKGKGKGKGKHQHQQQHAWKGKTFGRGRGSLRTAKRLGKAERKAKAKERGKPRTRAKARLSRKARQIGRHAVLRKETKKVAKATNSKAGKGKAKERLV